MQQGHRLLKALKEANRGTRSLNLLNVPATVSDGETITIGTEVYEIDTNGVITAGNKKVDVSAGGTKASGTVTSNNTNVSANDTVTVGATVYTFVSALTAANQILIGASADASLTNLASAINLTAGAGTTYGTGTVQNASASSSATPASHVLTITALVTGTGGNSIALAKSATTLSVSASTLSSGAQPTGAQLVTALVTAFNSQTALLASSVAAATNDFLLYTQKSGLIALATTTTMAGSGNAWAATATYGGQGPNIPQKWASARNPNAKEVSDGNMYFCYQFAPTFARVTIRTSAGVIKTWDGVLSITGNVVKLDNSGSTDWAATDTIIVEASE